VGATGAVGEEMIQVLHDRSFPLTELVLLASERSAGKKLKTAYGEKQVELFTLDRAQQCDIVLMAVSGGFSTEWSPQIVANSKTVVVDNSSAFRYDDNIPLVIPEINPEAMKDKPLIANPNCTTAIAAMALWPLHQKFQLKRVIVSTYQAASGAGAEGMTELEDGTRKQLAGEEVKNAVFAHPLPFNVIPHIDSFQDNGYTKEEMKVVWETQKIFGSKEIACSCTAVRIPTLRAHSEAITIETEKEITPEACRDVLKDAPGVELIDDPSAKRYPMPLTATKKYDVEVGRIRQSLIFQSHGVDLFVTGDQLLRGAALNAVLIAEKKLPADVCVKRLKSSAPGASGY
jgi:aspartate-semialdehyde dehydrogenase